MAGDDRSPKPGRSLSSSALGLPWPRQRMVTAEELLNYPRTSDTKNASTKGTDKKQILSAYLHASVTAINGGRCGRAWWDPCPGPYGEFNAWTWCVRPPRAVTQNRHDIPGTSLAFHSMAGGFSGPTVWDQAWDVWTHQWFVHLESQPQICRPTNQVICKKKLSKEVLPDEVCYPKHSNRFFWTDLSEPTAVRSMYTRSISRRTISCLHQKWLIFEYWLISRECCVLSLSEPRSVASSQSGRGRCTECFMTAVCRPVPCCVRVSSRSSPDWPKRLSFLHGVPTIQRTHCLFSAWRKCFTPKLKHRFRWEILSPLPNARWLLCMREITTKTESMSLLFALSKMLVTGARTEVRTKVLFKIGQPTKKTRAKKEESTGGIAPTGFISRKTNGWWGEGLHRRRCWPETNAGEKRTLK